MKILWVIGLIGLWLGLMAGHLIITNSNWYTQALTKALAE